MEGQHCPRDEHLARGEEVSIQAPAARPGLERECVLHEERGSHTVIRHRVPRERRSRERACHRKHCGPPEHQRNHQMHRPFEPRGDPHHSSLAREQHHRRWSGDQAQRDRGTRARSQRSGNRPEQPERHQCKEAADGERDAGRGRRRPAKRARSGADCVPGDPMGGPEAARDQPQCQQCLGDQLQRVEQHWPAGQSVSDPRRSSR